MAVRQTLWKEDKNMIRKFLSTVAVGSLFVGGLAASGVAIAQQSHDGHRGGPRGGGMIAMADANKDGKLSKAELTAALDARFTRMDANRDGKLTQEDRDLRRQTRLDERFAKLDSDKNGQISKAEFAAGHQARGDRAERKWGGQDGRRFGRGGPHGFGKGGMFGGFGRGGDKDGPVTRAEFLAQPLAMFDRADANKDGFVTAEEMQAVRQAARDAWQARQAADAPKK